jgi:hypothetical protein
MNTYMGNHSGMPIGKFINANSKVHSQETRLSGTLVHQYRKCANHYCFTGALKNMRFWEKNQFTVALVH